MSLQFFCPSLGFLRKNRFSKKKQNTKTKPLANRKEHPSFCNLMSESFQLIAGRDNPTGVLGKNAKISIINIFQYFKIIFQERDTWCSENYRIQLFVVSYYFYSKLPLLISALGFMLVFIFKGKSASPWRHHYQKQTRK